MDKAALLTTIEETYAELEATLAQISPEAMTTPGVTGEWSTKDVLAHITFWEQRMLTKLEAVLRGERPQEPITSLEAGLVDGDDWTNQLNARVFAAQHERPLPEILADFRSTHAAVIELLRSLPAETVADSSAIDALLGDSLHDQIKGDTYEHYQEHAAMLRTWLDRTGQTASDSKARG